MVIPVGEVEGVLEMAAEIGCRVGPAYCLFGAALWGDK